MTLPNFLVVGAAKSGTTALYDYLKQHPQIYMSPNKETNFFAFEGRGVDFRGPGDEAISKSTITTMSAYEEQFEGATDQIAIGEVSPWYLYSIQSAKNIHRHIPNAKLVTILRNPVDRAFSSYLHVVRDDRERLTFEEGLLAEKERIEQRWEFIWHYRQAGFYATQVERFLKLFPREQIRFYLYDDLVLNPGRLLKDVYEFLEVDPAFAVDTSFKPNATGIPKSRLLARLLFRPNPLRSSARFFIPKRSRHSLFHMVNQRLVKKPSLNEKIRKQLLTDYKSDVTALGDLIDRDLRAWFAA